MARRTERMQGLQEREIKTLAVDITDDESTALGVKQILAEAGRIDVLVNNAGYGSYGAVEDVPLEEARRQFEVNLFGAARLIQLVLPTMRSRRSGTIINITSMGGRLHTPFGAWYHGTKFALEAVSDCLRLETKAFGITVVVIEPGAIRTEWGGIAADHLRKTSGQGPYADRARAVADSFGSEATAKPLPWQQPCAERDHDPPTRSARRSRSSTTSQAFSPPPCRLTMPKSAQPPV